MLQKDQDLRAEILQDVDRCMPENMYFRQPDTQRMLLDILFVFCKLNPDVGYRQGMHELLAPILWVIDCDAIDLGRSSKTMGEDAIVKAIFDADHVEHDAFALFSQVMQSAKNFYEQTTHSGKVNPMVARSERIFDSLLPEVDPELAKHLKKTDIVPQVFLIRWVRLLFGREFTFDDVLAMWDVMFAEDSSLEIVDHICVAMLLRIRWELLKADYNSALTLLLRYPELEKDTHAQTFVLDALYLRDHLDREGGSYLILKYSGRPPRHAGRPSTPPALQRNITTFSGVNAAKAAAQVSTRQRPRTPRQARGIEDVLQSTAKNILARSERLGINKAVRGAVDEVHRRAQEIRDAQTPSSSPTWRARGTRVGSGVAELQLKALEKRNMQLAKLLEGAVDDLWNCQKGAVEDDDEELTKPRNFDQINVAIAKVQFVQVYLADASLPLPDEEADQHDTTQSSGRHTGIESNADVKISQDSREGIVKAGEGEDRTLLVPASNAESRIPNLVDPSEFEDDAPLEPSQNHLKSTNEALPTKDDDTKAESNLTVRSDPAESSRVPNDDSATDTHALRPPLAQSSFSWMLGQQDFDGQTNSRASPTMSDRARARGFLFGGEEAHDERKDWERRGSGHDRNAKASVSTSPPSEAAFDLSTLRRAKGRQ